MTKTTWAISGILLILGILVCAMVLFCRSFGFSHIYPAIVSIGFLILGFYYLRTWIIPNHFLFGLILIILAPVVFLTTQIFFSQEEFLKILISEGQNLILSVIAFLKSSTNKQNSIEHYFGRILPHENQIPGFSHWWVFLFVFGNWLTFNKRFSFRKFISVNFSIGLFCLFLQGIMQSFAP